MGIFKPWDKDSLSTTPQNRQNQHDQKGKGIHPVDSLVPGLYDLFIFDASDPAAFMKEVSVLTGPAGMPPKLEGQIAVGINHSLSLSPFWGSDIGGFYPNREKTGGAFCSLGAVRSLLPLIPLTSQDVEIRAPLGVGSK